MAVFAGFELFPREVSAKHIMLHWTDQHRDTLWLAGFPIYFIALWCLVGWIMGNLSGWAKLATHFRATAPFGGTCWHFQSASMRWNTRFGNCLTVGVAPNGLYLSVVPIFRLGHPPLHIPWEQITVSERGFLFWRRVRLGLGRESNIPFSIGTRLASRLRTAEGDHWPVAEA